MQGTFLNYTISRRDCTKHLHDQLQAQTNQYIVYRIGKNTRYENKAKVKCLKPALYLEATRGNAYSCNKKKKKDLQFFTSQ